LTFGESGFKIDIYVAFAPQPVQVGRGRFGRGPSGSRLGGSFHFEPSETLD